LGSVGFAYDRYGERFAVKSVRLPPPNMPNAEARAYGMQPWARLCDEVTRTAFIRSSIEGRLCDGRPTSLLAHTPWLHHRHATLVVHEIVIDAASSAAHVVMTSQQGSLWDLWRLKPPLPARDRYLAAKSLAIQGFAELSVMHELALYGHGDVSLNNVLYDRSGRMRLCDFDFAEPLNRPNGQGRKKGLWGTLLAPEMLEAPDTFLAAAADTFALAVAVFELAGEPGGYPYSPFYLRAQGNTPAEVYAHAPRFMERLRTFRLELASPDGYIRAERIPDSRQRDLVDFFLPLARADAPLAELLLNGGMQLDPARRSSSWALASELQRLDHEGEPMDWAGYQKMIARVVGGDKRHSDLRDDARAFVQSFVKQQQTATYGSLLALSYVKQSLTWLLGTCQPKITMVRPRAMRVALDAAA
jgi:hypothetical protein